MFKRILHCFYFLIFLMSLTSLSFSQSNPGFLGKWSFIKDKSSDIDLFESFSLEFQEKNSDFIVIQSWGGRRGFGDTLYIRSNGEIPSKIIRNRVFRTNVFMGLSMPVGKSRQFKAKWETNTLKIEESYNLFGSQGETKISVIHSYELSPDKETLIYTIHRSTRKKGKDIKYVFKKEGTNNAYFMKLEDNWEIKGKLPVQAFLISLQGLVNIDNAKLYFVYPEAWDYRFTPAVFDYLKTNRNYTFTQLDSPEEALKTLINSVKGYIVWDKKVRTSLIVAFTAAGLDKAIVVTEDMIPIVEKAGLKLIEDFRDKFTGKSDVEIYKWAYDKYWNRCSKDFIIWMGGEHGNIMKPGVADFGISKQAFFNDLSTKPSDTEEYNFAKKLFSEMSPMALVMGWHSYKKDREHDHVRLASNYALRVEGLHTLPNMSFSSKIPPTTGFKFKNNHNVVYGKEYFPKDKVYISCIQTDCLGLGAWTRPGRGSIPYTWEVTMNWVWLAPAMLEYFYSQATPNDYFIGSLSGPGYMYPKAIPSKYLPKILDKARELMEQLDLNVFEIMDYSEGSTIEGNSELTKEIVEAYYNAMPKALGFVNGYAPAYTFTVKESRPFISYDYYLSPTRPEEDAVSDLQELAEINPKRPYFLLAHMRQWSDISRVKNIIDKLGDEFELVPLDIFLKMAGNKPTFKEHFLEKKPKNR